MGKLAVYKYAAAMFLTLQVVVSVFTLVGLFGGNVTPVGNTARAMCVYILPILIAANIVLMLYWIIRRKWLFLAIPVLTVACCIPYIGTYYQFSLENPQKNTQNGLKIASYNVAMFKRETSGFMAQDILAEMRRQKVDILCMQEYNEISGDQKNSESYKEYFPYQQVGRSDMVIFSRYPITGSKTILFEETNNSAMWADINVNGKEFRVFNVHLETTGINGTLHRASKTMFQQHQEVDKSRLMNAILGNYTLGLMFRSGQAITIANEKRESEKPTILCGDFNDVPYSFVYNTVKGDMVDGFKECGAGWMYTYRGMKNKPVRIDYIFHDESIKGLAYYKTDLTYSDHFPVFMKIALQ
jgi:endonuclease/exonuclease/phosphatase family metal-dependent hydrolase